MIACLFIFDKKYIFLIFSYVFRKSNRNNIKQSPTNKEMFLSIIHRKYNFFHKIVI